MNTPNSNNNHKQRVTGIWEPKVSIKKNGEDSACVRRKVVTQGTTYYPIDLEAIVGELRKGHEVLLCDDGNDSGIRLYPCMDSDITEMFVAAQTIGEFRKTLNDIKFKITSRGQSISRQTCNAIIMTARARAENHKRLSACPTRVVSCPQCGYEFEIGGLKAE